MNSPLNPEQIFQILDRLRQLTQIEVQENWQISPQESIELPNFDPSLWETAPCNDKGYIVWSAGRNVRWLKQSFLVPESLQGYPLQGLTLRLVLTWWAEDAQIFVNGTCVQQGDLFDSSARILLTKSAKPGSTIEVLIRLLSPGHDIGALMRSHLVYEGVGGWELGVWEDKGDGEDGTDREELLPSQRKNEWEGNRDCVIDPGFVADELTVLYKHLETFEPEKLPDFSSALELIDWNTVSDREKFERSLSLLRQKLLPLALNLKQRCIHLLGHAHLDMAWLWTVSETWEVAQRTFESVLSLQQDFPNLTFCHTSPALYAWIEKHRPHLFKTIQESVKEGSWEVLGGMWIEPEVNLVSGESLVRQLLYGQRYIQEKFGKPTTIAWLPDSFGFCWQLPQILKQSGIEYFVTQKLHWNDSTKFPYGIFWWESPDGTQILTLMSPPNLTGVMDTNPLTMTNYLRSWEQQTGLQDALWLPGVGDHGGGPSRDMLEVQQRWRHSPFFPRLEFTTATEFLNNLTPITQLSSNLFRNQKDKGTRRHGDTEEANFKFPVWKDELYLEFHRGCYTTHADQKKWNRRCEQLLYQAELWSSLGTVIEPDYPFPKSTLEKAWKKVLFNQFHDILPGTSIPEVFVDANRDWQAAEQIAEDILQTSLQAIADRISIPSCPHPEGQPIVVFNSLNWERSEVVEVQTSPGNWEIYDLQGNLVPSQQSVEQTLLFFASEIPSVGYRLFWLCPVRERERGTGKREQKGQNLDVKSPRQSGLSPTSEFTLENQYLSVTIDPKTGDLSSVYDKTNKREVLDGAGNQLQAFQDQGQYWDAWNIDPNYAQHPLPPAKLQSIQWLEQGKVRSRLRVIRTINLSTFCQDYILDTQSLVLKITTQVDWQEEHTLVKAAFSFKFTSDFASYEIPCGIIQRLTKPQTPEEKAKWEVPALHWADLTSPKPNAYGVSLLNNCKYGYSSQPNQLNLTLLRSPHWTDPQTDRGIHNFTYALYPHSGTLQAAKTVHRGYEFNFPLIPLINPPKQSYDSALLPPVSQLLNLSAENLILMAFKLLEENPEKLILRCYECYGNSASIQINSDLNLKLSSPVDSLERPLPQSKPHSCTIDPWKIVSYTVKFSKRTTSTSGICSQAATIKG